MKTRLSKTRPFGRVTVPWTVGTWKAFRPGLTMSQSCGALRFSLVSVLPDWSAGYGAAVTISLLKSVTAASVRLPVFQSPPTDM